MRLNICILCLTICDFNHVLNEWNGDHNDNNYHDGFNELLYRPLTCDNDKHWQ